MNDQQQTARESLARMNDAELKAFAVLSLSLYGQTDMVALANEITIARMQSTCVTGWKVGAVARLLGRAL